MMDVFELLAMVFMVWITFNSFSEGTVEKGFSKTVEQMNSFITKVKS